MCVFVSAEMLNMLNMLVRVLQEESVLSAEVLNMSDLMNRS